MYKKIILIYLLFLIFLPAWLSGQNQQPALSDALISKGIELSIHEQYDAALALFDSVINGLPQHPAGYFFTAAIWQTRGMDFETSVWNDSFYTYIDNTLRLAEQLRDKEPDNAQAYFYLGAAHSYSSFQKGRDKKYFSAIKTAIQSVGELKQTLKLDSLWCDPYLGIGSYEFWRSHITRNFSWLPFFPDKRQMGIAKLQKTVNCETFSKWAAISNLAWIYIEQENFTDAIALAQMGLDVFPTSRFFLWPLGDAQFKDARYHQAMDTYTRLLQSVTAETMNNHYNEIVLYLKLGECYYQLEDYHQALTAFKKVLSIEPDKEVKDRVSKKKDKAAEWIGKINQKR